MRRWWSGTPRTRRLIEGVTAAGWTVLTVGLLAGLGGLVWGNPELGAVAVLCGFCLLVALVAVWLPLQVEARVELTPPATVAGQSSRALVHATKRGRFVSRHPMVAVPTRRAGKTAWAYDRLPDLHPDVAVHHVLRLAPVERGVVEVGPVGARRTDPLGLLVRHEGWTGVSTLFVRPRMVEVEAMTPGHVRDLDGAPSDKVTMNDLAFHALREYVPGDDLRHVHWRSSARAGTLHVRQYHDSRRAHVVVIVDDHAGAYPRPMDFELAMSIAASITVRLGAENQAITFSCGQETITGPVDTLLDATCRGALVETDGLVSAADRTARAASGASQVVLVSGVRSAPERLQAVRETFSSEAHFLGISTGRVRDESARASGGVVMLNVRKMVDLPGLLLAEGVGE